MKCLKVVLGLMLALFSAVAFAQAVNVNTATAEELDKGLAGIGPAKAAAIVKYRETNGPFRSVDDLANVPGIKGGTLDKIRPMVSVGAGTTAPALKKPSVPAAAPQLKSPTSPAAPTAAPAKLGAPSASPTAPVVAPKLKAPAAPVTPSVQ
ncbi:MAG: helix-hairpin-helix domain-containing protein [Candidatus Competibacteraceae bacterium]|nr:helix-hairpin-helix domain-containing protein [Candidatus Competibacteraceae bacterium]MBK7982874.1 helix-hairpin-helix domain-containing protein [Candidatus Competibacteraceae bacterium]MBK8898579.1 helix-hairpin-helix domain-containing protein [Candidatus Competibacteraceae bacterium]MBK8962383.1 helix-hairpin-helix domain-containing protein [Candidatus Competibacteraceae bacterium]MBK9951598.1 helix-hairpin-helix domain-containing protein [Candidatus Competibacteraceae bacterium]